MFYLKRITITEYCQFVPQTIFTVQLCARQFFSTNYYDGATQPPQEMQMSMPSSFTYVSDPGGHWHCGIPRSMQHTTTTNLISFSITKHNLLIII